MQHFLTCSTDSKRLSIIGYLLFLWTLFKSNEKILKRKIKGNQTIRLCEAFTVSDQQWFQTCS